MRCRLSKHIPGVYQKSDRKPVRLLLLLPTLLLLLLTLSKPTVCFAQELSAQDQVKANQLIESIEQYKQNNDLRNEARYLNQLGQLYWNNDITQKAIEQFERSLELNENLDNLNAVRSLCNNLVMLYNDLEQHDQAIIYSERAVETSRKMKKRNLMAESLYNLGMAYKTAKQHAKAAKAFEEANSIYMEYKNQEAIRNTYKELSDVYFAMGEQAKGKEYYDRFQTFNDIVTQKKIQEAVLQQAVAEERARQIAKQKNLELKLGNLKLKLTRDSLLSQKEVARAHQLKIDLLNKQKQLDKALIDRQQQQRQKDLLIIRGLVIGGGTILLLMVLVLTQYFAKRRANKKLEEKNEELRRQKDQISSQNIILREQKDQIEEQKEELSKKNQQITDSIKYASKIQEAILPSRKAIMENFPESFVFYRPRDIVSGDFYWFAQHESKFFIAAVDCTGHSVPGAFITMIGNTLLNEIINEKHVYEPDEILERLNSGVVNTLHQQTDDNDKELNIGEAQEDGMDITLCCIDKTERKVSIASANHLVHIFNGDGELKTIEGDIYSIGGMFAANERQFTKHTVDIEDDMILYLFSDGFQDQFGGPKNKKFLASRFQELLKESHKLPMKEQMKVMESKFDQWRGNNRQIDDVLVIGLKMKNL